MYLLQFDMFAPESRDAVISYKVVVPRQYFGLVTHFDTKSCFFKLTALGGKTFNSYDVDNHILRDLIFKENINSSMFYRLALESKVPLNSHLSWVSRLDYQGVINARADTTLYNSWDEEEPDFYPDGAGIRLRSFNAFLGAEIKF